MTKTYIAIYLKNSDLIQDTTVYEHTNETHFTLREKNHIKEKDIASMGFISDGVYEEYDYYR